MPERVELANRECKEVLRKVMAHKMAHPFMQPVDPVALGLPDYFDRIAHPMDLGTIRANLQRSAYSNGSAFVNDVRLVFTNATTYNPSGSDVHIMAQTVSEEFERLLKPYVRHVSAATTAVVAAAQPEAESVPELTSRQMSQLLNAVKRTDEGGWYFSEPVDPVKLGIPDYFTKISHPMDLGARSAHRARARPLCPPPLVSGVGPAHGHWRRARAPRVRSACNCASAWVLGLFAARARVRLAAHPAVCAPCASHGRAPLVCATPGTVDKRLEKGMYEDTASFVADVRLVWSNAKSYNPPGSTVHQCALKLEEIFERDLRRACSGVSCQPPLRARARGSSARARGALAQCSPAGGLRCMHYESAPAMAPRSPAPTRARRRAVACGNRLVGLIG